MNVAQSGLAAIVLALALGSGCAGGPSRHHQHQHRSIEHQRFQDPERWAARFDSPERDRWQRPDWVLKILGLRPEMKVAEIGSGTGYFTVRLARQVPRGKAWGIDIEPKMVEYLEKRAAAEGLPQLESLLGTADDPRIPEPVDLIFICNTYHHIGGRPRYFRRLKDRLQPEGRLVVVDFKMGKLPVGPPEDHRVSPRQLHEELAAAGYRRIKLDTGTLPYQYIAIYGKLPPGLAPGTS